MNLTTFFLVFSLTIVVLGITTSPASADSSCINQAAPVFSDILPTSGSTAGGTAVIITGSGFTNVTGIEFGSTAASSYTFISDTEITATTPAGTAGLTSVVITTPCGSVTGSDAYNYTAPATTPVPIVSAISPTYGPVSTSTSIIITGSNLTGATAVTVGGTAVTSFTDISATEIVATTPASSTVGQVDVLVTTPNGTSSSVTGDKYTFAATATTIPVPVFYASATSGTAPLEITFTDESTGNPASWDWSFGDGNTSTLEDPTHTYVSNGTYSVTLTETNLIGTNETTREEYIMIGGTVPAAGFYANPTDGTAPLIVKFTDTSTNSPAAWAWEFGDGGTSTLEDPTHTYETAGTYPVTLTATNAAGSTTDVQTSYITVSPAGSVYTAATTSPTPVPAAVNTYAIPATTHKASESSNAAWLAEQNAMSTEMAVATQASGLPPVISLVSLVCVALFFRIKHR